MAYEPVRLEIGVADSTRTVQFDGRKPEQKIFLLGLGIFCSFQMCQLSRPCLSPVRVRVGIAQRDALYRVFAREQVPDIELQV